MELASNVGVWCLRLSFVATLCALQPALLAVIIGQAELQLLTQHIHLFCFEIACSILFTLFDISQNLCISLFFSCWQCFSCCFSYFQFPVSNAAPVTFKSIWTTSNSKQSPLFLGPVEFLCWIRANGDCPHCWFCGKKHFSHRDQQMQQKEADEISFESSLLVAMVVHFILLGPSCGSWQQVSTSNQVQWGVNSPVMWFSASLSLSHHAASNLHIWSYGCLRLPLKHVDIIASSWKWAAKECQNLAITSMLAPLALAFQCCMHDLLKCAQLAVWGDFFIVLTVFALCIL